MSRYTDGSYSAYSDTGFEARKQSGSIEERLTERASELLAGHRQKKHTEQSG